MIERSKQLASFDTLSKGNPYMQVARLACHVAGHEETMERPPKGRLNLVLLIMLNTSDDPIPVSVYVCFKHRRSPWATFLIPARAGYDANEPYDCINVFPEEDPVFLGFDAPCRLGLKLLCPPSRRGTVTVIAGGFSNPDQE